jgi:hypothetical protein
MRRPTSTSWLGDSIGHWEGDTLVVDTTNFTDEDHVPRIGENLHVVERFRRVDPETIPLSGNRRRSVSTFTKPWTLEYPFRLHSGPGLRIRLPRRQLRHD